MPRLTREQRQAARALRRERRQERRAARRERRQARREDLATMLTPLIQAAEILIVGGAEKLVWVVDQFTDLIDVPGLDEEELDQLVEESVELIVAQLFPD